MQFHRRTPGSFGGCSGGNGPGSGPRDARNSVEPTSIRKRATLLRRSGTISMRRTRVLYCWVGYLRFWRSFLLEMFLGDSTLSSFSIPFRRVSMRGAPFAGELLASDDLPVEVLARGLEALGDEQVHGTISVTWLQRRESSRLLGPSSRVYAKRTMARIRTWLEARPEVQKAVTEKALGRWAELDGSMSRSFEGSAASSWRPPPC